jgi:hypothetical protein
MLYNQVPELRQEKLKDCTPRERKPHMLEDQICAESAAAARVLLTDMWKPNP